MDTKQKEPIGDFARPGRTYRPKSCPAGCLQDLIFEAGPKQLQPKAAPAQSRYAD
ncbi:hypothetical protein OG936_08740 [Streptomyces sp. NBC_00846]|uniref:hypothetical protein n=1 Tax=Streptomyces sp. NBC_00846 TaxID=2975849 RepID=UPI003866B873|nr:hypothetical protein OG936_08740 [Streptomyces sp. NBC_00846]